MLVFSRPRLHPRAHFFLSPKAVQSTSRIPLQASLQATWPRPRIYMFLQASNHPKICKILMFCSSRTQRTHRRRTSTFLSLRLEYCTALVPHDSSLRSHSLQLEQLSESSLKEFFIKVVDMIDSGSVTARSRAMVALCNFLSKGKGRDKINIDGLSTLLPKLLRFLPADRSSVFTDAETFLAGFCILRMPQQGLISSHQNAGATSGTICNLSNSISIRKQCCDMGFLGRLIALISQSEVFSTRHATGALWNLVVDNDEAKLALASDGLFLAKLAELFSHSDHQVTRHFMWSLFHSHFSGIEACPRPCERDVLQEYSSEGTVLRRRAHGVPPCTRPPSTRKGLTFYSAIALIYRSGMQCR